MLVVVVLPLNSIVSTGYSSDATTLPSLLLLAFSPRNESRKDLPRVWNTAGLEWEERKGTRTLRRKRPEPRHIALICWPLGEAFWERIMSLVDDAVAIIVMCSRYGLRDEKVDGMYVRREGESGTIARLECLRGQRHCDPQPQRRYSMTHKPTTANHQLEQHHQKDTQRCVTDQLANLGNAKNTQSSSPTLLLLLFRLFVVLIQLLRVEDRVH